MAQSKALTIVAAMMLAGSAANADDAGEAKAHYQKATAHFAVGEFADAGEEYQTAYKLKPDPALLFNAAQAFRLAGNNEKALILYKNFLNLYPGSSNAGDVRTQILKLEEAIKAADKARASQPGGVVEPSPARVAPTPTTKAEAERPIYKKWWLWTAVVGAAVVVGVVVGVAVVETRPSPSWSDIKDVGPAALGIGGRF